MQMSRRELLDDFLDFVVESGDSAARNTAERLYNRALMTIWRKHPWRQFRMPTPCQITLQAGVRSYVLPATFGRVAGGKIRNISVPNDLVGVEPEVVQTLHPEAGTTEELPGKPNIYMVGGTCGISLLLAVPELITLTSSDASDGSVVKWTVEGFDSHGRWTRLNGVMNGTGTAVVGTLIPWTFSKAYAATTTPLTELTSSAGTVTMTAATSGVLQDLLPYESAVEHQVLTLYPVPDATGDLVVVPYLRRPVRSLSDGDVVPMDWSEALFEEMVIQWRVNQGELGTDQASNALRPKFLDLLAFENGNRFGYPSRTRPFIG
jgi:hypothetical protein